MCSPGRVDAAVGAAPAGAEVARRAGAAGGKPGPAARDRRPIRAKPGTDETSHPRADRPRASATSVACRFGTTPGAAAPTAEMVAEPIVIANSHLTLIKKEEVPSQRDGVLRFIGVEVKPDEQVSPYDRLGPFEMADGSKRTFRRLKDGDKVKENDLLAQVDDTLAVADLRIKEAKLQAAKADMVAAVASMV